MKKFKELLFLLNISRVGPVKINKEYVPILSNFKTFEDFLDYLKNDFNKEKLQKAIESTNQIMEQIFKSEGTIKILTILDEEYPIKLKDLGNNAPPILYGKGNIDILNNHNLAIIGTRKPDKISIEFEKQFTEKIIEKTGRVILSGLALGCDRIAHKSTVDVNAKTIAFLPSGVNKIVPATNKKLSEEIIDNDGCLLSTFAPNAGAFKSSYVMRDEYVAAMSDCIFDIQCGVKSGTMHTVNFAKEYGRKIAVYLPNNSSSYDFTGNEFILNNDYGAYKISNLNDIDGFLDYLSENKQEKKLLKKNPNGQATFDL